MGVKILELMIVFFLSLNLFSGMLVTSGVASDIGLGGEVEVGGDQASQEAQDATSNISTGAPTGSTLFGMYNVLASTLGTLRTIVLGGPSMLANAGVPSLITNTMRVMVGVAYGLGIIMFLRGL